MRGLGRHGAGVGLGTADWARTVSGHGWGWGVPPPFPQLCSQDADSQAQALPGRRMEEQCLVS